MTTPVSGPAERDAPRPRPVLEGVFELSTGIRSLRLQRGEAEIVDGVGADVVMAGLSAPHPAVRDLHLDGRSVDRQGLAVRVRRGLVPVGPEPVAPDVSIRDHLAAVCGTRRADALVAGAPLLAGRGDDRAGILSGGERRVLGLLRALALDPIVVVLDRVGAGLDDDVWDWAGRLVAQWQASGVALVVRPALAAEREWFA